MSAPLVSVVICIHDGEEYLAAALDSIAAQNQPSIEVVVVDDGSTDNSRAIAVAHRLRPVIVAQEHQGHGAALNVGVAQAKAPLLSFLDQDDMWPAGRLSRMLAVLAQDPAADYVFGRVVNTNAEMQPIAEPLPARLLGAMVIRREALLRVGPFRADLKHAHIIEWHARADEVALRGHEIEDLVLLRRIHGSNLGIRDREGSRTDLIRVVRERLRRTRQ